MICCKEKATALPTKNLLSVNTQRITDFRIHSFLWMTDILVSALQDRLLWNWWNLPKQEKLERLLSKTIQGLAETALLSVSYWKKILSVWAYVILPLWTISTQKTDWAIFSPCRTGLMRCTPRIPQKKCGRYSKIKACRGSRLQRLSLMVIRRTKPSLPIGWLTKKPQRLYAEYSAYALRDTDRHR